MANDLGTLPALRTWWRRFAAVAAGGMVWAATQALSGAPVDQCRAMAEAHHPQAAGVCLAAFLEGDAEAGGSAARAFARVPDAQPLVRALAEAIGDREAWAWHALGRMLRDEDPRAAAIAYERALAHRDADDHDGVLGDLNGLLVAADQMSGYPRAIELAARAYEAAPPGSPRARSMTLINVAGLMLELGNLDTASALLTQAQAITPFASNGFAELLEQLGLVEQALGHPQRARQHLRIAQALAGSPGMAWDVHTNLLDLAIEQRDLGAARDLVAHAPPVPALPNDRAAAAYYLAQVQILEGDDAGATHTLDEALASAPATWRGQLEAVRGRALRHTGRVREAEQALLYATQAFEQRSASLGYDALKSSQLVKDHAAFEDLFLLYVEQGRPLDALAVVERATARSVLDGLLASRAHATVRGGILATAARVHTLRALIRSPRASPSTGVPPVAAMLERMRGHHVVTYFRAGGALWAIAIRRNGDVIVRSVGELAALERAIEAWLRQPDVHDVAGRAAHDLVADQLGAWLLPDALAPAPDDTLYVVPDDAIREITFASLRRDHRYVVERNPVAYGLSLASLIATPPGAGDGSAVVVGDPLGDLRQARWESIEVAGRLGAEPHVGKEAVRGWVRGAIDASILHVAAHTDGTEMELADGTLEVHDILELPRVPPLVTLLGCSSARRRARDELGSLAVAFVATGAHTVVAALWAINDERARELSHELYAPGAPIQPITALARAQREMIAAGVPVEQWATFVVLGGL